MAEQKKVVTKKTTAKAQGAEAAGKAGKAATVEPAAPARTPNGVTRKTTAKKAVPAPVERPVTVAPSSESAAPPAPPAAGAAGKRGRKGTLPAASVEDHPPVLTAPGEVTPEQRWRMVADAAYFRAEKRNFAPGYEQEDWLAAEAEVAALLQARAQSLPAEE